MSQAAAALKLTNEIPLIDADYIGVDYGALILARNKIPMTFAIGDFDSVRDSEMELVREFAKEIIYLNPVKDDSDSEAALRIIFDRGYDHVFMFGATGGRADHMLVNLALVMRYAGKLTIVDSQNRITACKEGNYNIEKNGYPYISFFTDSEACITLEGTKYPLEKRKITRDDLYTLSNEITGESGVLRVHEGKVMIIQSDDRGQ